MKETLIISVGQYSSAGKKRINQDFHGTYTPNEPLLSSKGIAAVIADGISSSAVSQVASEMAVSGFLNDYYSTSDAWSVKTSAQKVLQATNSWLHAYTRSTPDRFDKDKGYVCTFSALIIKSRTAHIFHCGDTRICRLSKNTLEPLTKDHHHTTAENTHYLTKALGIHENAEVDYKSVPVEKGDIFILSTDGVHDYLSDSDIAFFIQNRSSNLDQIAQTITQKAIDAGSHDNVTLQILCIDQLPAPQVNEVHHQIDSLPLPPQLQPRSIFDGYQIIREIYMSSRSHVYLARDLESQEEIVIKIPSVERRDDVHYLESFLMEEWVAKRINNPHVLKAIPATRKRNYLYSVTEFIDGQNLSQWMLDNPKPELEVVRKIIEQIAKGMQAFHRQEMIHQDIRPQNIMIDTSNTVKIIDFGSVKVAGITEIISTNDGIVGTMQYSAPEYFLHETITPRSDIYSLGVIVYEMLSGQLPFGVNVCNATTKKAQRKLRYHPLQEYKRSVPQWVEVAIKKSVCIYPLDRYDEVSEFIYDLRHPNKTFVTMTRPPLIERNPLVFWQSLCFLLLLLTFYLAYHIS